MDGILGGNATIALSAATTITLSVPATGTVSASAGPNQSQNAVVKFSGTLTGNCVINLTLPRIYIFDNQCTVGTSYIQIAPASGTGTKVGLPPGVKTRVAFDGTNVDFVGMGIVGALLDICGISTTPAWMTACTVLPYLPRDGATYSTSVYPALGAQLGSTFGGNGITTFAVPDTRNRFAIPIDTSGQGRVTSAGSGVDGTALAAAGGSQFIPAHTHTATVNEPNGGQGHNHQEGGAISGGGNTSIQIIGGAVAGNTIVNSTTGLSTTGITITGNGVVGTTGSSGNMPPVIVFGCGFIKT